MQYSFLAGHSTVWQLLTACDDWCNALGSGTTVYALFLDASKAFDRIDHDVLVEILKLIGFQSLTVTDWFDSYL